MDNKTDSLQSILLYQQQLLRQTKLTLEYQFLFQKFEWYKALITLLGRAHNEDLLLENGLQINPMAAPVDNTLQYYKEKLDKLEVDFLRAGEEQYKTFLNSDVLYRIVDRKAVLICKNQNEKQNKDQLLDEHMQQLKTWVADEIKKIVIDRTIFSVNPQYQRLLKQKQASFEAKQRVLVELKDVVKQVEELDEKLISDTEELWKDVVEAYQLNKLEHHLSPKVEGSMDAIDKPSTKNREAEQVMRINPSPRTFDDLKKKVCKFISHLYQKEDYITQYSENKFFRLMIEIIEEYASHENNRRNGPINKFVSYLKVNEKVKAERNGEVELVIALLDLAVKQKLSQQDINSTFTRLAANARRGITGHGSLATKGRSHFHDKISQVINLLHTDETLTRFGQSYDLHTQQIQQLQTGYQEMKDKSEHTEAKLTAMLHRMEEMEKRLAKQEETSEHTDNSKQADNIRPMTQPRFFNRKASNEPLAQTASTEVISLEDDDMQTSEVSLGMNS
ncbi:MAG: hypothetical protein K0S11_217 [Gammaproteobacteria bacterium]|jgi:hypothetical protein|nr:hypothetical protein [Gammaproteobacteria bacterium]